MKEQKFDWVLRLARFNEDNEKVITYVNLFYTSREEVIKIAKDYAKRYEFVRIYKFETLI